MILKERCIRKHKTCSVIHVSWRNIHDCQQCNQHLILPDFLNVADIGNIFGARCSLSRQHWCSEAAEWWPM